MTNTDATIKQAEAKFKKLQYEFAANLRDPKKNKSPSDIEDRRMEVYRGLFYRNIETFISNSFPVLRKLYNDDNWHNMVRDFFSNHQSISPYFKDISKEFLSYLEDEREIQTEDPIFIKELAHYEWIEIYLTFTDTEINLKEIDTQGDLLSGIPALSPLAHLHSYHYPVHQIKPDFQPDAASEQPSFLMIYRDQKDNVGFMELNPVAAMLVNLLQEQPTQTGKQLLDEIFSTLNHANAEAIYAGGEQALKKLRAHDILLGTKAA